MGLQMKGPRIGRRRDEIDRARRARVAHIGDRKAVRKHVPDKGMALVDHDLHAVAAAALVAMPDKFDVARGNRVMARRPLLKSGSQSGKLAQTERSFLRHPGLAHGPAK